jgi:ATP-dependent DNA ligase
VVDELQLTLLHPAGDGDRHEAKSGRWGQGLTAEKMKDCRWLRPRLVGQFEFVEWTPDGHLRHVRFMGTREDKDPKEICRED